MKSGGIAVKTNRVWLTIILAALLSITASLPVFGDSEEPLVNLFLFDTDNLILILV